MPTIGTRTRAKPPEGSREPGQGSRAPADPVREQADQTHSYPGGGSSTGSDHPVQDEEADGPLEEGPPKHDKERHRNRVAPNRRSS